MMKRQHFVPAECMFTTLSVEPSWRRTCQSHQRLSSARGYPSWRIIDYIDMVLYLHLIQYSTYKISESEFIR